MGWPSSLGSAILLCFLSIMSTSLGLLCFSRGILTHIDLVGIGLGWLCGSVMGLSLMSDPRVFGMNWVCTLGFRSSWPSVSVWGGFNSFSLSSMSYLMLDFSMVASIVPDM